MPFLTLEDPNAKIKGSRDPLGVQPIWAAFGRHVVTNLTTQSSSVRGFTTLLLGRYFAAELVDRGMTSREDALDVFLRMEQLSAYVRHVAHGVEGEIRGIERVRKTVDETRGRVPIHAGDDRWFYRSPLRDNVRSSPGDSCAVGHEPSAISSSRTATTRLSLLVAPQPRSRHRTALVCTTARRSRARSRVLSILSDDKSMTLVDTCSTSCLVDPLARRDGDRGSSASTVNGPFVPIGGDRTVSVPKLLAISEFPKWRKYLILLPFLDNSSARPVQIGGVDVNICHSRVDRSPRTPAVQFAIPPRGDHFVAHGRALWKLTGRGRTERAHRALENAVRFPRASTRAFPIKSPTKNSERPLNIVGKPG